MRKLLLVPLALLLVYLAGLWLSTATFNTASRAAILAQGLLAGEDQAERTRLWDLLSDLEFARDEADDLEEYLRLDGEMEEVRAAIQRLHGRLDSK